MIIDSIPLTGTAIPVIVKHKGFQCFFEIREKPIQGFVERAFAHTGWTCQDDESSGHEVFLYSGISG
jgi:hypothetical protein